MLRRLGRNHSPSIRTSRRRGADMTSTRIAFPSRTAVGALLAIATLFGGVAFARAEPAYRFEKAACPEMPAPIPELADRALRPAHRAREPEKAERAHDHPFGRDHPGRVGEPEARSDRLARRRSRRRRDYRDPDGARRRPQPRSRRDLHVAARDLFGTAEPDLPRGRPRSRGDARHALRRAGNREGVCESDARNAGSGSRRSAST